MKKIVKPYKKDFDYSYTSGASVTVELLKTNPGSVESVYIHSAFTQPEKIESICSANRIPCILCDSVFKRINQKENTYVLGVFKKTKSKIAAGEPHVILVNPADMGNLGTIIRTLAGFDICNLGIINPAADIWNPKTIRASMGSIFHMNFQHFDDIEEYLKAFPKHHKYTFMLDADLELYPGTIARPPLFSLIFGNEATGLDGAYKDIGTAVKIPQSMLIDSLNLSIAVAVGVFSFTS